MSSYSFGGYVIALQTRSKNTILVEGKTDKDLLDRILLSRETGKNYGLIDTSDIVSDPDFSGMGAKQKIDAILSKFPAGHAAVSKITAFVDREWEGLIDEDRDRAVWSEPVEDKIRFVSLGHSIENYSFTLECVQSYLIHFGSGLGTPTSCKLIGDNINRVMVLALAFSEAARSRSAINRCKDLVRIQDIEINEGCILLSAGFLPQLNGRNVPDGVGFVTDVNSRATAMLASDQLPEHPQLLAHGHLGENILWACCAKLLLSNGADPQICEEVAFGRKDERRRFGYNWVTKSSVAHRLPIDELLEKSANG